MAKNELLSKFLKNNKSRRLVVASNAGFSSVEAYIQHLNGKISAPTGKVVKKKVSKRDKPTIHNVYILDRSSSMNDNNKIDKALEGINSEISQLKQDKNVNYTQTIVDFSYSYDIKTPFFKVPLADMKHYTTNANGMTALYQAIGQTLDRLKNNIPTNEKVLVKIFTDGEHNQWSGKYSSPSEIKPLIAECESRGFTITFVGTEFDVKNIVNVLHIDISNTLTHDNTEAGVQAVFMCSTDSTMNYSKRVLKREDVSRGFYKKAGTL